MFIKCIGGFMKIGIMDSGKGGLAVAKRIKKPEDQLIVLLDQAFFPYGTKTKEVLLKRALYLSDVLLSQGIELLVLACNTLSILAGPFLKSVLPIPVLGVFDYFQPYLTSEYTLIGSKITIEYAKQHYSVQTVDGTDFIEAIEKKKDITPFINELKEKQTKALLLGCTHFLVLDAKEYPLPTIDQITFLQEDIQRKKTTAVC